MHFLSNVPVVLVRKTDGHIWDKEFCSSPKRLQIGGICVSRRVSLLRWLDLNPVGRPNAPGKIRCLATLSTRRIKAHNLSCTANNRHTVSKDINKLSQVELPSFLKIWSVIISRWAAVLLTRKQVKWVFCPKESIVIKNLHSCHPVWTVIMCNLTRTNV